MLIHAIKISRLFQGVKVFRDKLISLAIIKAFPICLSLTNTIMLRHISAWFAVNLLPCVLSTAFFISLTSPSLLVIGCQGMSTIQSLPIRSALTGAFSTLVAWLNPPATAPAVERGCRISRAPSGLTQLQSLLGALDTCVHQFASTYSSNITAHITRPACGLLTHLNAVGRRAGAVKRNPGSINYLPVYAVNGVI